MAQTGALLMFAFIFVQARAAPNVQLKSWNILRSGIASSDPVHRAEALTAISSIGATRRSLSMVEDGLTDKDPIVRQTAATALGEMKSRRAIPALEEALSDKDPEVRVAAARSLWELGDHKCRGVLMDMLAGREKTSQPFVKQEVGLAVRELHQPGTIARIGITQGAEAVLGPYGMGIGFAEEILKDDGAVGRSLAAKLLGSDSDPKSFDALEQALLDKNSAVRAVAARSLGERGRRSAIPDLEPLLDSTSAGPRFMAAAAIIRLSLRHRERR
ncbi:MAG: HEAT repeat domain-containing protein [Terriglobia bacterium]